MNILHCEEGGLETKGVQQNHSAGACQPALGAPIKSRRLFRRGGGGVTSEGTWDRSFWQGIASCPEIGSVCSSAPGSDLGIRTIGGGEEALSTNSYALAETDRDCPVH